MESTWTKKLREYVEENGVGKMLLWSTAKSLKLMVSFFYQAIDLELWIIDLDEVAEYKERQEHKYRCKHLQKEDLLTIERRFGKAISEDFAKRLGNARGYLIFDGNDMIGYAWSSHSLVKNQGLAPFLFDISPKGDIVYFYNDFIGPEKRGQGANTQLMHYRLFESKKAGFKRALGIIDKHNIPQVRIHRRYGWKVEGHIGYRKYLWLVAKNTSALEKFCDVP